MFFQPNKLLDVKIFSQDPICWGFTVMVTNIPSISSLYLFSKKPFAWFSSSGQRWEFAFLCSSSNKCSSPLQPLCTLSTCFWLIFFFHPVPFLALQTHPHPKPWFLVLWNSNPFSEVFIVCNNNNLKHVGHFFFLVQGHPALMCLALHAFEWTFL